jgi:hypothetical protein
MAKSIKTVLTRQDIIKGFYDSETAKALNINLTRQRRSWKKCFSSSPRA